MASWKVQEEQDRFFAVKLFDYHHLAAPGNPERSYAMAMAFTTADIRHPVADKKHSEPAGERGPPHGAGLYAGAPH